MARTYKRRFQDRQRVRSRFTKRNRPSSHESKSSVYAFAGLEQHEMEDTNDPYAAGSHTSILHHAL